MNQTEKYYILKNFISFFLRGGGNFLLIESRSWTEEEEECLTAAEILDKFYFSFTNCWNNFYFYFILFFKGGLSVLAGVSGIAKQVGGGGYQKEKVVAAL